MAAGGLKAPGTGDGRRGLWVVLALVLLIRLPFLNHAIQGDDVYYLAAAEHAQIDPLHPNHVKYIFLGDEVDLRGHSHPPLNAWILAGLLAAFGDIREVPFHAAYVVFSLIAAAAMWSLARRFSPAPLWAALLFVVVPAFAVNGNSLESDLPFLAFWMAAVALFCAGRLAWAALAMALAAMAAYQAVFLTPILAVYVWLYRRKDRVAWLAALVPPLVVVAWQVFERASTGAMPAGVLANYFSAYGFQALAAKLRNAAALAIHACFLVCPILLPAMWRKRGRDSAFLWAWAGIFFVGALVVFFAGSARYLLPMAAPVALLASRAPARHLAVAFGAWLVLSLGLAAVNSEHWDGYRRFAASLRPAAAGHRVWIDAEWGLRYYLEAGGGLPLRKTQALRAGDVVVASELAYPVEYNAPVAPLAKAEIRPAIPLRLIGIESRSGYSTASRGLWPFGISSGPIDRVRADLVMERRPSLEYLRMDAAEAPQQIVSGIHALEPGGWRWMARAAVVVLKSPAGPTPLRVAFAIPGAAPARTVRLLLDGREAASRTWSAPGAYTLETPPLAPRGPTATVTVTVDKTFSVPGDSRELGVILTAIGFAR